MAIRASHSKSIWHRLHDFICQKRKKGKHYVCLTWCKNYWDEFVYVVAIFQNGRCPYGEVRTGWWIMVLQETERIIQTVINDTVLNACKNTLPFAEKFSVEGQLQIVMDEKEIVIIKINETVKKRKKSGPAEPKAEKTPPLPGRSKSIRGRPGRKRGRPRKVQIEHIQERSDSDTDQYDDTRDAEPPAPAPAFPNLYSQMYGADGKPTEVKKETMETDDGDVLSQEDTAAQLQKLALQLAGDMSAALSQESKEGTSTMEPTPVSNSNLFTIF